MARFPVSPSRIFQKGFPPSLICIAQLQRQCFHFFQRPCCELNSLIPKPYHVCWRYLSLKQSTSSRSILATFSKTGVLSDVDTVITEVKVESELDLVDKSMIDFLIQYKSRNGDCHIPTGKTKNAKRDRDKLGVSDEVSEWVSNQRRDYRRFCTKNVKISNSLAKKIKILESIGFIWSCREAHWQRFFNKLDELNKSRKEGDMIRIKAEENPHLYSWIQQQRKAYKKGNMPMKREKLLKEINFVFDANEARWWENYHDLCRYHEEHGDTMVPLLDDHQNPNYLGQWVARQRRLFHSVALRDSRISALNKLGFSWDPEAESWANFYNQLCDFHREYHHTRVPKSMGSLWNWVDRQRRSYRKRLRLRDACENDQMVEIECSRGTLLTSENIQKLSAIGFEWEDAFQKDEVANRIKRLMNVTFEVSIHDENWAKHYDKLCAFHRKFKHFSIPTGPGEYKELNTWVRHTRYLYNANKLRKNRIELLDSIGFAWTAEAAKWDRLCEEFLSFHEEFGHSDVPIKNSELYRWTKQQKENLGNFDHCQFVGAKAKLARKRRLCTLKKIFL